MHSGTRLTESLKDLRIAGAYRFFLSPSYSVAIAAVHTCWRQKQYITKHFEQEAGEGSLHYHGYHSVEDIHACLVLVRFDLRSLEDTQPSSALYIGPTHWFLLQTHLVFELLCTCFRGRLNFIGVSGIIRAVRGRIRDTGFAVSKGNILVVEFTTRILLT